MSIVQLLLQLQDHLVMPIHFCLYCVHDPSDCRLIICKLELHHKTFNCHYYLKHDVIYPKTPSSGMWSCSTIKTRKQVKTLTPPPASTLLRFVQLMRQSGSSGKMEIQQKLENLKHSRNNISAKLENPKPRKKNANLTFHTMKQGKFTAGKLIIFSYLLTESICNITVHRASSDASPT